MSTTETPPEYRKVLVAGATGMLGREVVALARSHGAEVRALARDGGRAKSLGLTDVRLGDARKRDALNGVCDGVDAVFSSLGASVALKYSAGYRGYRAVDIPANLNLLDEAQKAGVKRFVYVSAYVIPETVGITYFAAHEAVAREVLARPGGHVLRPTAFFSALRPYLMMGKKGRVPLFGDGSARSNPVHDTDLAEIGARTLVFGGPAEQDIGGPDVLTREAIAGLALEAWGKPPRFRRVPPWLARSGAFMLTPFSPRLAQLVRFATEVSIIDLIAPQVGKRRLGDWFRDEARAAAAT